MSVFRSRLDPLFLSAPGPRRPLGKCDFWGVLQDGPAVPLRKRKILGVSQGGPAGPRQSAGFAVVEAEKFAEEENFAVVDGQISIGGYMNHSPCSAVPGAARGTTPVPAVSEADRSWDVPSVPAPQKFQVQDFLNVVSEIRAQNTIHAVSNMHGAWERIQVIIDSGSNVPVMPVALAEKYSVKESRVSKAGVSYAVANGNQIPNLGEKFFPVVTKEGTLRGYQSQCADVTSVLQSVNL